MDEKFKEDFKKLVEDVGITKKLCMSMNERLTKISREIEILKKDNEMNKSDIQHLLCENYELRLKLNEMEQYNKKSNLIIQGVPVVEVEDLMDVATKLANKLKVDLKDYDVAALHRLPSKKKDNEAPPIIVKLNNLGKKSQLYNQAKKMKPKCSDIGLQNNTPIFVDEHLTKESLITWMMAKICTVS